VIGRRFFGPLMKFIMSAKTGFLVLEETNSITSEFKSHLLCSGGKGKKKSFVAARWAQHRELNCRQRNQGSWAAPTGRFKPPGWAVVLGQPAQPETVFPAGWGKAVDFP
jgi:hypothetical protein